MASEYLTPEEVATALKVSSNTVRLWCRSGKIPAFRFGGVWRVHRAAMEQAIRNQIGEALVEPIEVGS
ncbi:MAG: helix-turn-helix domain-containing protein [Chloroflexi bacterium]|nr:helix-turn-helix domain-containing protein [Chloroflexota bacterium]